MLPDAENEVTRGNIENEMERVTGIDTELLYQIATRSSMFPDTSHITSQYEEGLPQIGFSGKRDPCQVTLGWINQLAGSIV
jgi:hypothetical protein